MEGRMGWSNGMEGIYTYSTGWAEREKAPEKWCPFIPEAAKEGSPWLVPEP